PVHPSPERVRPWLDARADPASRRHGVAGRGQELARQAWTAHTQHGGIHRPGMGRPYHPRALEREHHPDHALRGHAHRSALVLSALDTGRASLRLTRARLVLSGADRPDAVALPPGPAVAMCTTCLLIVFVEAFINVLGAALTIAI